MTTLAHIREVSAAIETTLAALRNVQTDEKLARAALLDLYLAGINQGKAETEGQIKTISENVAKAVVLSKDALQAITELEMNHA